ncbi:lipolytic enzyme / transcription regulator protein [Legionella donaldsonii]|uniref:Lipolytic enzyme / transcription regulator protein n=1 Tax=Legionella donaldsonii TaxID=45060 RepID=A0A378J272_9GAMM|nr:helix-turn-helix transcriptional regulator [Legionella donaldsonii]STX41842.1 lipolytic enzyme / transcription regulator protein [Legionella donaldsonii]
MVKTKQESLRKTNLIDSPFFKVFAKNYLDYLGNSSPTNKQLAEIQALLSNTWIRLPICFDLRLSEQEKQCLYLSAQGKEVKEIAAFLKVSTRRVTQHRQSIFQKLNCKNITSAIIVGLRFGVIKAEHLLDEK